MTSEEYWEFYRRCAQVRMAVQTEAVRSLPPARVVEWCKRFGLQVDREGYQEHEGELAFAFDMAIHTAPAPGRSRAIDRVGARFAGRRGEETALVLNALMHAWVSIFRVQGPHPVAGLVLEDLLLGGEAWVLDEALTALAGEGQVLAARIGRVAGFCITTGVVAPVPEAVAMETRRVVGDDPALAAELAAEPRFAFSLWMRGLGFVPE